MRVLVWISLFMVILSVILLILGGMYNPNSVHELMLPGQISAYAFTMHSGEKVTLTIKGTDYFTFYLMNESAYNHLSNGNFTDSYYANTTQSDTFTFTAPSSGKYYIVLAAVNSQTSVEVTIIYGASNTLPLLLSGVGVGITGLALAGYEVFKKPAEPDYDTFCPNCGTPMKSTWNYCPQCRYSREERE
ncbi:MAG: zinc ribbon domain-containing protein [Euryarchaeota archaeon]|nr:zinc ribbon domain-containing protein [Euryarchaeota archaeon]